MSCLIVNKCVSTLWMCGLQIVCLCSRVLGNSTQTAAVLCMFAYIMRFIKTYARGECNLKQYVLFTDWCYVQEGQV